MDGVCDVPGVSWLCTAAGDAADTLIADGSVRVLAAVARGIASFATLLLDGLWGMIQRVTHPQTDAEFLQQWAGLIFGIALPITVMFMVFQIIQTLIRARGWTRTGTVSAVTGAAVAIAGTAVSLPIVHGLTRMVDGAAEAMAGVVVGDLDTLGENFADAIGGRGVGFAELLTHRGQNQLEMEGVTASLGGLIGVIVVGFLMILGGIAVFAALLIRSLLLYAVVVTGPIAFLGLVWTPARAWFRRWCVAVTALVFTKLGVVVVFGLGVSAMNTLAFDTGILEAIGRLLAGALLMLIAALVPIVAFKFFDFLGEETAASLHAGAQAGMSRTREAFGQMDPRRIAERMRNQHGSDTGSPSSAGRGSQRGPSAQAQPAQTRAGTPSGPAGRSNAAARPSGGRAPRSGPSGGTGPGAAGGATAGGGVAPGAGAVIGAGVAAGQKVASVGADAARRTDQQKPSTTPPPAPPPPVQPRRSGTI